MGSILCITARLCRAVADTVSEVLAGAVAGGIASLATESRSDAEHIGDAGTSTLREIRKLLSEGSADNGEESE